MIGDNGKAWMQKLTGNRIPFASVGMGMSFFWKKQIIKELFDLRILQNSNF
jgi:hypothetical protein